MSNSFDFTAVDARRLLSAAIVTTTKAHKSVISCAVVVMLANAGEISVRDFKKEQKETNTKNGDRSIQGYISIAGLIYREHGTTFDTAVAKLNDRSAKNVLNMVNAFCWGSATVRGKWSSVDECKNALTVKRAERDDASKAATAAASVMKLIDAHGALFSETALHSLIKAAVKLDPAYAETVLASAEQESDDSEADRTRLNDEAAAALLATGLNTDADTDTDTDAEAVA